MRIIFIHIEIKKLWNICLTGGSQERFELDSWDSCKNKGFSHQEIYNSRPYAPSPCLWDALLKCCGAFRVLGVMSHSSLQNAINISLLQTWHFKVCLASQGQAIVHCLTRAEQRACQPHSRSWLFLDLYVGLRLTVGLCPLTTWDPWLSLMSLPTVSFSSLK